MPLARLLAIAVAVAVAVAAAPAAADDDHKAKEHVARATKHHKAGRFVEALAELEEAHALAPSPALLYAIAQVNVKLGRCPVAIKFYEFFLDSKPPRDTATLARQAIKVCKTKPPPAVTSKPKPPPKPVVVKPPPQPPEPVVVKPPPPPEPPPVVNPRRPPVVVVTPKPTPIVVRRGGSPWYSDILGDVLVVSGVAAGVGGGLLMLRARRDLDRADAAPTYEQHDALVDRAHRGRLYAVIAGGSAIALVGVGIIRYATRDDGSGERALAIVPTPSGGMVQWSWRY